ncbi:MAG TPA: sigma 54-interacting transcriptional regulator, partial [Candidatus Acidoferrales bacterium]|nr:sigma 54-interacting transcriptional regulator [Candidatus Acidoferrales bacterium]
DEISTISPETQAKLLRVIQEREFMRLGGTDTIKVDVRIIAASNEDLMSLVHAGRFREDLYHRLNVINIALPPLRDRREDIPLLVERFLERFSKDNGKPMRYFSLPAMRVLMDYDWPGNVRELENVVERAIVLSNGDSMDVDLLPEAVRSREIVRGVHLHLAEFLPPMPGEAGSRSNTRSLFEIMEEVERRIIIDMLEHSNWNQTEAAERFQIPLSTLNQKIKRLGIETRRRNPAIRGAAAGAEYPDAASYVAPK